METTPNQTTPTHSELSTFNNNNNNNHNFEIENLFLLRMPTLKDGTPHQSTTKLKELVTTNASLKDRLFIDLNTETRKGSIKLDDDVFKGRLVDLPCIIESLKSTDKKTFFKTGDLSQMFVCKAKNAEDADDEDNKSTESDEENDTKEQEVDKKYSWMHGITAPLKNARKKRFRRVAKKKIIDYAEIEKEVKSLFRADRDAVKVEYEVLYMDEPQVQTDDDQSEDLSKKLVKKKNKHFINDSIMADESLNNLESISSPGTHVDSSNDGITSHKKNKYNFYNMDEVIGDLSSSSDESDADSDQDDLKQKKSNKNNSYEMMDTGDESTNLYPPNTNSLGFSNLNYDDSSTNIFDDNSNLDNEKNLSLSDSSSPNRSHASSVSSASSAASSSGKQQKSSNELNARLEKLLDELEQIQMQRKRQEDEINQINNPVLKSRLLSVLNELIDEEKRKSNEIENVRSLMG